MKTNSFIYIFLLVITSSMISTTVLNPNMTLVDSTMPTSASEVYTTPAIVLSSPPNITIYTTDTNVIVAWTVTVYSITGNYTYQLFVDGVSNAQGSYNTNNTAISFNVSAMHLSVGLHNLTLVANTKLVTGAPLSAKDTVFVNILSYKVNEVIPAGTTTFTVNGTNINGTSVPVTISVNVSSPVTITLQATSTPPNGTNPAFSTLDALSTGYFLQINVSDEHAIREAWINISYAGWNLATLGITEQNLRIVFFNTTSGHWELAGNTGVDTARKIIYAHTNHLSAYSAVSFVHVPPSSTTTVSNTSTQSKPLPGLELLIILLASTILSLVTVKKRRNKKDNS